MRKLFPILLIGCLSILFAEVFSGASQAWFVDGWGILVTFPLYLGHVLFFLWIALKIKRISLTQLYLFGVIFALYESWITKVLWTGYMDSVKPMLGTFLGIGIAEFPILVFFWHPIMSFILPILVFQILTKKVLKAHESILKKTTKKTTIITLFLILISTFVGMGNKYILKSINYSLIGTLVIITGLYYLSKVDLKSLEIKKNKFVLLTIYLAFLYIGFFFILVPNRIPTTIMPFISIIIFYVLLILLIIKSNKTKIELNKIKADSYTIKDIVKFMAITILAANIVSFVPSISMVVMGIAYTLFSFIGIIIFLRVIYKQIKQLRLKI